MAIRSEGSRKSFDEIELGVRGNETEQAARYSAAAQLEITQAFRGEVRFDRLPVCRVLGRIHPAWHGSPRRYHVAKRLRIASLYLNCGPHDKPTEASDVSGVTDAGIDPFSAAYRDYRDAEVLFVSGVSLYDARGVLFSSWVKGGPKLIVVNPKRDTTAVYAEENGGLFLQIQPGTDTLLHNSIAWVILTEGWEDSDFISESCADEDSVQATSAEFDINNPQANSQVFNSTEAGAATLSYLRTNAALRWRRIEYGLSSEAYRDFIMGDERHDRVVGRLEDPAIPSHLIFVTANGFPREDVRPRAFHSRWLGCAVVVHQ